VGVVAVSVTVDAAGPTITEDQFLGQVLQLARIFKWRTAHFRPAKTAHGWRTAVQGDGKGFPDLVLTRPTRVVFAELKAAKGKLRPEQTEWIDALTACPGVETHVWRPADLDTIADILR
jgi:hypothetical protein